MQELVSIITPSYNTAKYISKTIESIQKQTYQNWEIIIVDDCSTDETDKVVEPYLIDNRIRYFKNEKNIGAAQSRNKALREAKGKWIAFLDSDDLWESEKLKKQLSFMQENDYHFSYTRYKEIDEKNNDLGIMVSGPKKITKFGMSNYCYPGCLTVMYDAERVGLLQIKDIKKNNDYAMWLQISENINCYLLDECLASYRRRKGSISNQRIITLIYWHYILWKDAMGKNVFLSVYYTMKNMFFGFVKKLKYVHRRNINEF